MLKTISIILFTGVQVILAQTSSNISLLYNWNDSSITRSGLHDNAYNEIWGYAANGKEYAIIGSTRGTHIFDVTNPSSAVMVDFVWGRDTGSQIIHRDYHDYKGYLYAVCDEGASSLQIMDLSYLPDSVHVVYDQNTLFVRSHNIFIDSATHKMYVCGGENSFDVYDLTNPLAPTLLKRCAVDVPWWASGVNPSSNGYVHDVYVRNDTAWCNAGDGLYVVDFTNIANPILLGSLKSYPHKGYNHSGWLSDDGKTYALADETHGKKVKIIDVSDISNMQFIDTIGSNVTSKSIPHNLIFRGNYLFVSYYFDGMYIWDLSNPGNPILRGFFDTSNELNAFNYRGNWGVYPLLPSGIALASDMQNGLFVFDVSIATSIKENKKEEARFKLFPNPSQGEITLMGLGGFNESYTLQVYDSKGSLLYQEEFKNQFLDRKELNFSFLTQQGIYTLKLFNTSYQQTISFIKQ